MTKTLEDYLNDIKGITNTTVQSNCFDGQLNVLEGLQMIQSKVNEVINDINSGLLKGEKGDAATISVGTTNMIPSGQSANIVERGNEQNKVLDFYIPKGDKGEKGDKGDPGNATINDNTVSLDYVWSSSRVVDEIVNFKNNIEDLEGMEYDTDNNFVSINGSRNGVITDIKLEGKTLVVDSNDNVVIPGTQGVILKSVGDDVTEIKLKSIDGTKNIFDGILQYGSLDSTGNLVVTNTKKVSNFIDVNPQITFKTNVDVVCCYDINKNFINRFVGLSAFITPSNCRYIRFRTHDIGTPQYLNNYYVSISGSYKYISDSKKVLYKDTDGTWKKPILRQRDSIEKHSDGKYYYHKRSENETISGVNLRRYSGANENNTKLYEYDLNNAENSTSSSSLGKLICDKFVNKTQNDTYNLDQEGCSITVNGKLRVRLSNDKVSDINNLSFNIIYESNQEQVFECTPIDLISYDTQTNYIIECGTIYPKSIFYISSDYGSVLSNIVRRMTQIENDIIEDRKAVFNLDFRTLAQKIYPEDFIIESEETENEHR